MTRALDAAGRAALRASRVSCVLLALLSLALSGCFISSDPLLSPAKADYPWPALRRAQQFGWENGAWKSRGYVSLDRDGAFYVLKPDDSDDVTRFLLHRIGNDLYVAQADDPSGSYLYALVSIEGNRVYESAFDDASHDCAVPGIDPYMRGLSAKNDNCSVQSLDALIDVFQALRRAQPQAETLYVVEP